MILTIMDIFTWLFDTLTNEGHFDSHKMHNNCHIKHHLSSSILSQSHTSDRWRNYVFHMALFSYFQRIPYLSSATSLPTAECQGYHYLGQTNLYTKTHKKPQIKKISLGHNIISKLLWYKENSFIDTNTLTPCFIYFPQILWGTT